HLILNQLSAKDPRGGVLPIQSHSPFRWRSCRLRMVLHLMRHQSNSLLTGTTRDARSSFSRMIVHRTNCGEFISLLSGVIKGSEICAKQTNRGMDYRLAVACKRHCDGHAYTDLHKHGSRTLF